MSTTDLGRFETRTQAPDLASRPLGGVTASLLGGIGSALASLRLTVVLLGFSLVLVFAGTLAQVDRDVWFVVHEYFRTFIAWIELRVFFPRAWEISSGVVFPFPGGFLLGIALAVNLVAAHTLRFRVAASGRRLWMGWALIAVGGAITWAVIASGSNTTIESELTPAFSRALWQAMRAGLGAAVLTLMYVLALSRARAMKSSARWLWWFGAATAAILAGLAVYLFANPEARLDEAGLRILWQLTKALGASCVLGIGCWAVFARRAGIVLLHGGIALLMFSELYTAHQSVEAQMRVAEGETAVYAEDMRKAELAVVDVSDPKVDRTVVIPASLLMEAVESGKTIDDERLPFTVRVEEFVQNATTRLRQPGEKPIVTEGLGHLRTFEELRPSTGVQTEQAFDVPAAVVELTGKKDKKTHGPFLLSPYLATGETLSESGKSYQASLRFKRIPKPYTVTLLDFKFDRYEGTETPKNFESVVRFQDAAQNVDRQASISMNNPLRYAGDTLYQADWDRNTERGTVLQVVSNAGWMIPYVACVIVGAGMLVHFSQTAIRFIHRREDESRRGVAPVGGAVGEGRPRLLSWARWRRPAMWAPALVVLTLGAWALSRARPVTETATEMKLTEFAALPVAYGGRTQPMDSLARNTLRTISRNEMYTDSRFDEKQPAVRWLLDVTTRSPEMLKHRVIRIENLDVLATLDLKRREGLCYSLGELLANGEEFERQVKLAEEVPAEKRNLTQEKFIELDRKVQMITVLIDAFGRPELSGNTQEEAMASFQKLMGKIQYLNKFAPRPVLPASPEAPWQTAMEAEKDLLLGLAQSNKKADGSEPVMVLRQVLNAYRDGKASEFNVKVAEYREIAARSAATERRHERELAESGETSGRKAAERLSLARIEFEAFFNHFDPFTACKVLYIIAFVLAAGAWLGWFEGLNRTANWLLWFTLGLHTFGLICRVYISGRPPVTNLYSSAVFIGWAAVLFALLFEAIYRLGIGNLAAAALGFPSMVVAYYLTFDSATGDTIGVMQAVLDTNFWLATHVVCISLGYTTTFLAGCLGLITLIMGVIGRVLKDDDRRHLTRMTYGTLCFAIFFSFIGTVLGGLWADDSWGRFWGWDPKENGALMIVIWNAIVLHARWGKMTGERGLASLSVLGNIVVAWSYFGVNQLSVGLHSYGRTQGVTQWLLIFAISHLLVVAAAYGIDWMRHGRRPSAVRTA